MEEILVKLRYEDQDGNPILDPKMTKTAMTVYNEASRLLINPLLIPSLNDILYAGKEFKEFPLRDRQTYEQRGFDMIETAYKLTAYAGFGKCGDKLVYPFDLLMYENKNEDFYLGVMKCMVEPLWIEDA